VRTTVGNTCCGDIAQIGRNKSLMQADGTPFSFDFAISLGQRYELFEEYLKRQPGMDLLGLPHMGLLPALCGINRQGLTPTVGFWEHWHLALHYRRLSLDSVLLSHTRVRDSGYAFFIDSQISLCPALVNGVISKAMQDSQAGFGREVYRAILREPRRRCSEFLQ
jgi:hypothetical protein